MSSKLKFCIIIRVIDGIRFWNGTKISFRHQSLHDLTFSSWESCDHSIDNALQTWLWIFTSSSHENVLNLNEHFSYLSSLMIISHFLPVWNVSWLCHDMVSYKCVTAQSSHYLYPLDMLNEWKIISFYQSQVSKGLYSSNSHIMQDDTRANAVMFLLESVYFVKKHEH